jgi:type VI secretion system secreted protein VgrG
MASKAGYKQAERPLTVTTPLGPDDLLLVGFTGVEGVSQLFTFHLDLLADNDTEIPFDKLLGQKVTVNLLLPGPEKKRRQFSGICKSVSQGARDKTFTGYRMEVVPQFWLLTRRAQSRIFQHQTVPDILKKVLEGLDVTYEISGNFYPRDYCVQYRETDFNFASRLMEEEGIFYFFKHSESGHQMVVANTPQSHPDMPFKNTIVYEGVEGGKRDEDRVIEWRKAQEVRSGKYTLWDHCFELPYKHLEADKTIADAVQAGKVNHKQKVRNDKLEIYDYPGEYAQRFDGVDKGGGEKPADLQKIFEDNKRTVGIRMQQETVPGLVITGTSTCRQFTSGYKFNLTRHFNADGPYLLTAVEHLANTTIDMRSGEAGEYRYQNSFTAIPFAQPFRPPRVTPKPFVQGTQTAYVVGPPGEEIFTDKYGRVKVQFHWDREGKHDADGSCWIRVTHPWAGKRWGASFWPRVGQEVIVGFMEGDPDQPIIVGTVYNADQMPPYLGKGLDPKHTEDNRLCGIKSNSTKGGEGFNEWRFDDTKGKEQIFFHAERNMDTRVKNDGMERVIHDRHLIVGDEKDGKKSGDQREMVYQDKHLHVHRHHVEHVEGNMQLTVGGADPGGNQDLLILKDKKETIEGNRYLHVKENRLEKIDKDQHLTVGGTRTELVKQDDHLTVQCARNEQYGTHSLSVGGDKKEKVKGDHHHHVSGDRNEKVDGKQSLTVGGDQQEKVGGKHALEATQEIHLKAGMKVILEAGAQLTIKGPGGFVDIGPTGVTIQGTMVLINSGGAAGSGSGSSPTAPQDPDAPAKPKEPPDANKAQPIVPTQADDSKSGHKSVPDSWPGPAPGPKGL